MCGRFTLATDWETLAVRFGFAAESLPYRLRYNVAPAQAVLTVTTGDEGAVPST